MVYIVKTHWAGLQGGPGITQMAFDFDPGGSFMTVEQVQEIVNAVRTFWNSINTDIPNDVTLTVDPAVDSFVTSSGNLVTTFVAPVPPSNVTGASASNYSAASGARIRLSTNGIKNNRRVRGAIFLVPLGSGAYDSNGSITGSLNTNVVAAGVTLSASLADEDIHLGVWSRPSEVGVTEDGTWYPITGMSVNTKVAVLRGRRD